VLQRANRLARADFKKRVTRRQPFRFGSLLFSEGNAKAAVVISKRTVRLASERNFLRRRLYAILREELTEGHIRKNVRLYPNKQAATASFADLRNSLKSAFAR